MCYYLPVFLCLFESFRRDLNEAKAVYISEYYLDCRFVIMTLWLHLKFIYFPQFKYMIFHLLMRILDHLRVYYELTM